jgi:hypothetical protein
MATMATAAGARAIVGEINLDIAVIELRLVEVSNGAVGFLFRAIRHKAESTRAARLAVAHHNGVDDVSIRAKHLTESFVSRTP